MAEKIKTSLGMEENVESLLCYVLGWLTGIIFFLLEKDNKTVRFHALQSVMTFLGLNVLSLIFAFIPVIGWFLLLPLTSLLSIVLWIVLMIKAYQGEKIKLPFVGDLAEKYS